MRLLHRFAVCAVIISAGQIAGCRATQRFVASRSSDRGEQQKLPNEPRADTPAEPDVHLVSHQDEDDLVLVDNSCHEDPFAGLPELPLELLITAVQNRNPSMQAAQAAWAAAAERYPQAVALEDPTLQSMFAPASFASNNSQSSYYLGMAQRVPWHGKRALRGEMANWESSAMSWDAAEVKLRLAVASQMAFLDYYLAWRELELNEKNVEVMQDFRSTAKSKYEANQVSATGSVRSRSGTGQTETTAIAIGAGRTRRSGSNQHAVASTTRSCFTAATTTSHGRRSASRFARIARTGQTASTGTGGPEFPHPVRAECGGTGLQAVLSRLRVHGTLRRVLDDAQQRPQVGMNMNVPIQRNRLAAAVREAQFRLTKLLAEFALRQDAVNEEVEIASARVTTNNKAAALYEATILPSAEANLESARAAYVSGSIDFLRLLEAAPPIHRTADRVSADADRIPAQPCGAGTRGRDVNLELGSSSAAKKVTSDLFQARCHSSKKMNCDESDFVVRL